SGSIPATVLQNKADRYGVCYPMQTFTKGVDMDYSSIPFFVEGDTDQTLSALKSLAALISESVMEADSEKRRLLHLASVFACNFTNHLIHIADTLLQEKGMDYKVLLPLIRQTVNKLSSASPAESQTGPAARNDLTVVNRHLEMLEDKPQLRNIYKEITDSIITQHELN
ncbi:MAG: DUF2520 domain-containing protein, partial [Muribaculaceae bacterium]|nr:DUF2520 domain-containing protein [Muribaculaceae bacterium]